MEENEPTQRRPRTANPAFSTPDQPTSPAKPAKAPPAVTFRPPSETNTPDTSRTDTDSTTATPPPRPPQKSTPRKATPPRAATPASKSAQPAPPRAKRAPQDPGAEDGPIPAARQPEPEAPPATRPQPAAVKAQPVKKAQPAAKSQPAKKATPAASKPPAKAAAKKAAPAAPTLPPPPAPATDPVSAGARADVWAGIIADPAHSPELFAVAATQTIGPRALQWARRTRAAYPTATPDAVARLAELQFTRFGSLSSLFAAAAGSYAPIALLGAAAFTHAELALHLAAAYGFDPTDRARAADLLVLTRVHAEREDAEAALAAAEEHSYENAGLTEATWRLGRMLAAQAGGWAALRVVNRFFPGTTLLAATLTSRGAARSLAARAGLFYRDQRSAGVRAS